MEDKSCKREFSTVGKNVVKKDGYALACGRAKFVEDYPIADALTVKILKSPLAHARIKHIDTVNAGKIEGVELILTFENVPKVYHTTAGQGYPEPSPYDTLMFDDKVRFVGDRVAAVAARTEDAANEALSAIEVDYQELPAIFDPLAATADGAPVIHDEVIPDNPGLPIYQAQKNLICRTEASVGDFDAALAASEKKFHGTYTTHYGQHCPIEPHVCLTYLDEDDRLVIVTSTQVPFHARRICASVMQIPVSRVRVIKPRIGGGFGAKQEVFMEYIPGYVTLKTRKPARLVFTRSEEFTSARTRHPHVVEIGIGVSGNRIEALKMKALSNTGAYGSHALTVVCNCGSKTLPMYNKVPNVKFIAETVYTNLPVGGAYRGYGATQAAFALESEIDMTAHRLGLDPIEFRKPHLIRQNEGSPIFKALGEGKEGVEMTLKSVNIMKCLEIGARESDWQEKRKNPRKEGSVHYGVGCCALMQGSSIPRVDMGAATIALNDDGSFQLLVGATDLGTGSDTVLSQIAAEELSCDYDKVNIYSSDTDRTPFDVGAYASSTTYLSGEAVRKAAASMKQKLLERAALLLKEKKEELTVAGGAVAAKSGHKVTFADIALHSLYQDAQEHLISHASHITEQSPPPFLACFCEVAVDVETGVVKVLDYLNVIDCGTAIHPKLAEGQVEGAALNGISYALTEEYIFDHKGKMLNPSFADYKIFSARDLPRLRTIIVDSYEPSGPFGAKSVSEIGINGPLPAIANAIFHAVGVRLYDSPFTPEKVLRLLKARRR